MADAPRLPPATEPTGYAPYSITALIALILASLFALVLGVLSLLSFIGGTQLVEPLLLVLPVAILVLAFAARRQILNSEGTRAGLPFCNFAWWVAVLGGCGYAAYLVGRLVGVQSDTKDALVAWITTLEKADPVDPRNVDFHRAFQRTLDTGRQASVDVKGADKREIEAVQKGFLEDTPGMIGLIRFRQLDLVRVLSRGREFGPKFTFDGLQTWDQDTSGLRAKSAGTLVTPEGSFKLHFDMMRQTPPDSRPVWRVVAPQQGFISTARLTRYGQQILDLESGGRSFVYDAVLPLFGKDTGIGVSLVPFRVLILQEANKPDFAKYEFLKRYRDQAALLGGLGGTPFEPPGYETRIKSQLFVPLDRADAGKDGDPRERFYAAWREGKIVRPGTILQDSPDQAPLMTVTAKAVELRVPVEIQPPQMEASQSAARGAVVLVCDDEKFIAKLNELRAAAATDPLADPVPPTADVSVPWQIRHVESDMKFTRLTKTGPGGPPQGQLTTAMPQ